MPELIIGIRCHKDPTMVLDTYDAAKYYTDSKSTKVMCCVDGNKSLAKRLQKCKVPVYASKVNYGWGAGLFTLLMESIEWSTARFGPHHFMTIDYDTLFMGKGADTAFLNKVDGTDVGLIGCYRSRTAPWAQTYKREKKKLAKMIRPAPDTYTPGEGVQGGCFMLTQSFIQLLRANGFMREPRKSAKSYTSIADDHFITFVCRCLGLDIANISKGIRCSWKASCDPRGKEGKIKVFHPIKMAHAHGNYNRSTEIEVRNYFREKRGMDPIK